MACEIEHGVVAARLVANRHHIDRYEENQLGHLDRLEHLQLFSETVWTHAIFRSTLYFYAIKLT